MLTMEKITAFFLQGLTRCTILVIKLIGIINYIFVRFIPYVDVLTNIQLTPISHESSQMYNHVTPRS